LEWISVGEKSGKIGISTVAGGGEK